MNLQVTMTQTIKTMNKCFILICLISILSCHQKQKETDCNDLSEQSFRGTAGIFFHKPISGSTYQIFLFPLCNEGLEDKLEELTSFHRLRKGISFNITSDDPQFKAIYNNAKKISLKGRDHMGENFKSIYYCFAKVEVSYADGGTKKTSEETKELKLESGSVILNFHFISQAKLKIDSLINL